MNPRGRHGVFLDVRVPYLLVAASLASVVLGCASGAVLEEDTCERGDALTDRPEVDVDRYADANLRLAQRLPPVPEARLDDVRHDPYTRCPTGEDEGDVVGVTSTLTYTVPSWASKCFVADLVEGGLEEAGWAASTLETDHHETGGMIRNTDLWRGTAHVTLSIQPLPETFTLFVDHDDVDETPRPADDPGDWPCTEVGRTGAGRPR